MEGPEPGEGQIIFLLRGPDFLPTALVLAMNNLLETSKTNYKNFHSLGVSKGR